MAGMSRIRAVPPVYFLVALVAQIGLHRLWPAPALISGAWRELGWLLLVPAVLLAAPAARTMARRGTTLHPFGKPSQLVIEGPFRYTRNPVYLALACILMAVGVRLGSLVVLLPVPLFMLAITISFIRREEQVLRATFGEAYEEYCRRVPRWL